MTPAITDDQNRIVSYSMDAQGRTFQAKTNQVYDGGGALLTYQQTDYTFDSTATNPAFFLTRIKNTWWWKVGGIWTSKILTQNDYTYNVAGMRLTNGISDITGLVRTETYGYDELYRLISVNYGDSHSQSYTFDAMGNRATKVNDGVSEGYTYNNANMLLTRGANNYTNDLDGNTLTGGGRKNTWDSQNRLVSCVNGANTSNFTYAADGIRHRSVLGANTTDFVLDGPMFVREKLNGAVSATYLAGPRGPEYRRDDSSGQVRWYVFDGHGSVLAECDPGWNLTATRSYDVFGTVRTSAGASTSKHKYVGSLGHPSEDETGLIYMQSRYMDPVTGRFASEDSVNNGDNWFAYCNNNPISSYDPDGHAYLTDACIAWLFSICSQFGINLSWLDECALKSLNSKTALRIVAKIANKLLGRLSPKIAGLILDCIMDNLGAAYSEESMDVGLGAEAGQLIRTGRSIYTLGECANAARQVLALTYILMLDVVEGGIYPPG